MLTSFRPSPFLPSQLHWQPAQQRRLPPLVRDWLLDTGSLTARLRRHGRFAVRLLQEGISAPTATEARFAGLSARQHARIREVELLLDDQPMVYARSVLPLTSLTGANRVLGHMARRSLGWELFRLPMASRDAVWITEVDGERLPHPQSGEQLWGRESLFRKRGQPILVAEFFLPALWTRVLAETDGE
ncbi:chorismate--pyruvate lyase family protein [Isoalcanivorax beigongshangi]|uniref:Probable chorismate pyruvate-lyase n=1 Tax=Isoalcanivorax beigongshangi TaxID=3238810 RepID=A0ABV4ADP4_9GAMM